MTVAPEVSMKASDWIKYAKKQPMPRPLLGELWREREVAVLFGEGGSGKSALAIQIAEQLARGSSVAPLQNRTEPQSVLYVDLETDAKQFELRYSADHEGGRARFLHRHYHFSDLLTIARIDPEDGPRKCEDFVAWFESRLIEELERSEAKVLIIDSLSAFKRSSYGGEEMLRIASVVRKLAATRELSVLFVAHSRHRETRGDGLTLSSLAETRMLARHASSVFIIGRSRQLASRRYIKQIRSRTTELMYDKSHIIEFTLSKIGGNLLGLKFEEFAPEQEALDESSTPREWARIDEIAGLHSDGLSIRQIAEKLATSKTTVHRLLSMYRGKDKKADANEIPADAFDYMSPEDEQREIARRAGVAYDLDEENDCDYADDGEPIAAEPAVPLFIGPPYAPDGHLTPSLDSYGRPILVEEFDAIRRPQIWYQANRYGTRQRFERKLTGILCRVS